MTLKPTNEYQAQQLHNLLNYNISLYLPHGSLLLEVAGEEVHGTTPVLNANRHNPSRLSLVFVQHSYTDGIDHNRTKLSKSQKSDVKL